VIVVVAGTGTEIGKTWCTTRLAVALRERGVRVSARKPAQSFLATDTTTDADELAVATGEPAVVVCPRHRWYPIPMAPPMAADALGQPSFTIADLVGDIAPSDAHVVLVEAAGGVRSPLAHDGDTVTLCDALQPDLVLVIADAGLGTIHAVRSSSEALDHHAHLVWLNRFEATDELHERNRVWLQTRCGLDVVTDAEAALERISVRLSR
jgi:dethiobiotin synthetase